MNAEENHSANRPNMYPSNQWSPKINIQKPASNNTENCAKWADAFSKLELKQISDSGDILLLGAQVKNGLTGAQKLLSGSSHDNSLRAQSPPCIPCTQQAIYQANLQNFNTSNRQQSDYSSAKPQQAVAGIGGCNKKFGYSTSVYSPSPSDNYSSFTVTEESSPSTKQLTGKLRNLVEHRHNEKNTSLHHKAPRSPHCIPNCEPADCNQSSFRSSTTNGWCSPCSFNQPNLTGGHHIPSPRAKFLDAASGSEAGTIQFRTPQLYQAISPGHISGYQPHYCNNPAGTSNDRKNEGCSATRERTTGGAEVSSTWSRGRSLSEIRIDSRTRSSKREKVSQLRLVKSNPSVSTSTKDSTSQIPDSWLDAFNELCLERKTSFKSLVSLCKKSRRHRKAVEQSVMDKILSECISNSKSSKSGRTSKSSLKSQNPDLLEQILQAYRLREIAEKFRSDPQTLVDALEKKSMSTLQPLLHKTEKLTDDILLAALEEETLPKYGVSSGVTDTVGDNTNQQEMSDADTLNSFNIEATLYEKESRQLENVLSRLEEMESDHEEYRERWMTRVPLVVDDVFVDQMLDESSVDPSDTYV